MDFVRQKWTPYTEFGIASEMPARALIIGYVWPEPKSSAAGVRDLDLIAAFREFGYEVHVASHAKRNDWTEALASSGVFVHEIELNRSTFDRWLAELAPDLVVFDRFVTEEQFGARVERAVPGALRILDTQDLHSLRRERAARLLGGADAEAIENAGADLGAKPDFLRELAAIYRSDLTLVLSDHEFRLLREHFGVPATLLHYLPFCYAADSLPCPAFVERAHFAFIGNFRHPPNYDAIFWTVREIWPEIRARLPRAELHIYGAYPPREVSELASRRDGIVFHGPVPEAALALAGHRVNLAALRFGAGIKGKIAEGWRVGTPAVTTEIGAEGMRDAEGMGDTENPRDFGGTVAASPRELAEAATALHEAANLWERASAAGTRILRTKFGRDRNFSAFRAVLGTLARERDHRRARNTVGAMLRLHQHRATDYFSRWIELKETFATKEKPACRE